MLMRQKRRVRPEVSEAAATSVDSPRIESYGGINPTVVMKAVTSEDGQLYHLLTAGNQP